MARSNKYASLNFNDIYETKIVNNNNDHNKQKNQPKTIISNSRIHGNMLVLTRPTPKPVFIPPQPTSPTPDQTSDSISLRPLGRTGSGSSISPITTNPVLLDKERDLSVSSKPDKFVPPHLRPGYLCKEEKPGPEFNKQQPVSGRFRDFGGYRQGQFGYGEEGRPKSGGGGYDKVKRGGTATGGFGQVEMNRPGSSGSRPNTSG